MKRLLAILVFVLILMALLGVFDKCNGADLGYAVGQNRVQMVELNYGVFNYARHTHDGTTNVFSVRLKYTLSWGPVGVSPFAGIGYSITSGSPEDLESPVIGHWGIQATYRAIGLRVSHWSNPFESNEYGHNMLTLFWRW